MATAGKKQKFKEYETYSSNAPKAIMTPTFLLKGICILHNTVNGMIAVIKSNAELFPIANTSDVASVVRQPARARKDSDFHSGGQEKICMTMLMMKKMTVRPIIQ